MEEEMSKTFKIIKTFGLFFSWVCLGLFSEVSSPTLPYLKKRVNSDYEEIARALVGRSVGFLMGSLFAGFIGSIWKRLIDLWISLALLMAGGATIAAPWCQSLELLSLMFFIDGLGKGLLAVFVIASVVSIWKKNVAVPTHALYLSFGIGALIAPQAARPFLPQEYDSKSDFTNQTSVTLGNLSFNHTNSDQQNDEGDVDRIEIAYGIVGGITVFFSLVFLVFQVKSKHLKEEKKQLGPLKGCCSRYVTYLKKNFQKWMLILFPLLLVCWALPVGAETAYGKFLFSFSVESSLKLSPKTATILDSVFWASFTAGRGLATIAAKWTPPHILLACDIIIKLTSAFILAFFANNNTTILWVFSGILGATISPIFPACFIWTNLYIEMTPAMTSFAILSAAVGDFVFSWMAGYLFEYKGPIYLMYLMVGYALLTAFMYFLLYLIYRFALAPRASVKKPVVNCETKVVKEEVTHL